MVCKTLNCYLFSNTSCYHEVWRRFQIRHHYWTIPLIVEAPFKRLLLFWCLCCIMMFRWTNKQPGIQKFWNWCGHYQDIYDWISPLNRPSGSPFILLHSSLWGEMSVVNPVTCLVFTSLKHFMMLLRCNFFQGFIFTPYRRHW